MKKRCIYIPHRNIAPIICNPFNRHWRFIKWNKFFTFLALTDSYGIFDSLILYLLNIFNINYFMSVNWISRTEEYMRRIASKCDDIKFIVVQHGCYGGLVFTPTTYSHVKIESDYFLVWGDVFYDFFKNANPRFTGLRNFGNPIYSRPPAQRNSGWVIAFTSIPNRSVDDWLFPLQYLEKRGLEVKIKLHNADRKLQKIFGNYLTDDDIRKFEGVVTDYSSVVCDASSENLNIIIFKTPYENLIEGHDKSIFQDMFKISTKNEIVVNEPSYYNESVAKLINLSKSCTLDEIENR